MTTKMKGCKLLHYIGHAEDGRLLVESDDDVGLRDWVDPREHELVDRMTQCVVIQSPNHMEVAEIFLSLKCAPKHVIAIKQPEDNFAHHVTDFILQFYYALIEGNTTIRRAFLSGLYLFEDPAAIAPQYRDTILDDFQLLPKKRESDLIITGTVFRVCCSKSPCTFWSCLVVTD